ncbi:hypothetical protein D3C76_916600 [compost metagenome]
MGGEHRHHAVAFLEQDGMAIGGGHEGVVAQAVDRQLDVAELDFQLAAFAAGQHRRAEMIADLELEPRFIVHHQRGFGVDFGNINAFGALFGKVNET